MASPKREPKLRVRASGLKGSGYILPTRNDMIVPGITTVTAVIGDGKGLQQWVANNTAAFAVANLDALMNRTELQGYGLLRFYHTRMKPEKFDDPEIDIRDYSNGVLNDLADLGTLIHEWIEDHVWGNFEPELVRDEQVQMAEVFMEWASQHTIEPVISETTVIGRSSRGQMYAGTLDHIWILDGVPTLVDVKSSRASYEGHYAQLAALGAAESMLVEVDPETEGAGMHENKQTGEVTFWQEQPLPPFKEYAILRVRPDDFDNDGNPIPAYCRLEKASDEKIAAAWESFEGALQQRHGEKQFNAVVKKEKEAK